MTPKITQVEARPGHKLHVGFENGESRLFDVTPYLDKGVFRELRDEAYFRRVRPVAGGRRMAPRAGPERRHLVCCRYTIAVISLGNAFQPARPISSAGRSSRGSGQSALSAAEDGRIAAGRGSR